jgi:ABC-2 type transport system ATP-binding protein
VVRTSAPADAVEALQRIGAGATVVDSRTLSVSGLEAQHVVEFLGQSHVPFSEVTARRATLEDVYLQLTGGEVEFRAGPDTQASS